MACHEIAGLRLGLMKILGIEDDAAREHEKSELKGAADSPGPLRSLCEAKDLTSLRRAYEATLADLGERVARLAPADPKRPYYQGLLVATKKVELDLVRFEQDLRRFWNDLEELHDFIHETYPKD